MAEMKSRRNLRNASTAVHPHWHREPEMEDELQDSPPGFDAVPLPTNAHREQTYYDVSRVKPMPQRVDFPDSGPPIVWREPTGYAAHAREDILTKPDWAGRGTMTFQSANKKEDR